MDAYEATFDWVQLQEGRARFSGGVRGIVDEQRHETFAVEVDGIEYFGEIEAKFLPNNNDYNIEVLWFGYGSNTSVGMPMLGSCQKFTLVEIEAIQTLIVQLIDAGTRFSKRPSILTEFPDAHFMGEVTFRDGWVISTSENTNPMSRGRAA